MSRSILPRIFDVVGSAPSGKCITCGTTTGCSVVRWNSGIIARVTKPDRENIAIYDELKSIFLGSVTPSGECNLIPTL